MKPPAADTTRRANADNSGRANTVEERVNTVEDTVNGDRVYEDTVNPARPETPATVERRLERLCDALHELPETGRRSTDHHATRILLSIDDIVGRVRALAALVEHDGRGGAWDLVDHATAQMLLRDLAVIARDLRAVASTVAGDLASADVQLRELERTLSKIQERMADFADTPATPDAP